MDGEEAKAISNKLMGELEGFLQAVSVGRLNRGLRKVFIDYIKSEMNIGFQLFFEDFVHDLDMLFDFLDAIEDEYKPPVMKGKL